MLLSDGLLDPSYFTCEAKNVKFGDNFVAFSETYMNFVFTERNVQLPLHVHTCMYLDHLLKSFAHQA